MYGGVLLKVLQICWVDLVMLFVWYVHEESLSFMRWGDLYICGMQTSGGPRDKEAWAIRLKEVNIQSVIAYVSSFGSHAFQTGFVYTLTAVKVYLLSSYSPMNLIELWPVIQHKVSYLFRRVTHYPQVSCWLIGEVADAQYVECLLDVAPVLDLGLCITLCLISLCRNYLLSSST